MPPKEFRLTAEAVEWSDIEAAAGETKLRKFKMTAYTGVPMSLYGYYHPVVVDLSTLKASKQVRIFHDHRTDRLLGHAENVEITDKCVTAEGVLTNERSLYVREVTDTSRNGTTWQASVGVRLTKAPEFICEGQKTAVNGRSIKGPAYIARAGELYEISFVVFGADSATSAAVAASRKESNMDFDKWLTARGLNPDELGEGNRAAQQLIYDAEIKAKKTETPEVTPAPKIKAKETPVEADSIAEVRSLKAAELSRQAAIEDACKNHTAIAAKAIGEGWSVEKAQLEVVRASRPVAPAVIQSADARTNEKVIECAMRLGSEEKQDVVEEAYDEKTLDLAAKHRKMGLKGLVDLCCRMEGRTVPGLNDSTEDWVRAAFSTAAVPNVLSNTANKMMHDAFKTVPITATRFARKLTVNDFKTNTGVNMNYSGVMEKVGGAGELKHGDLSDDTFTVYAETYGEMIGISRKAWINDDLGAFTAIPVRLGRKAARTLEYTFWTLVKANTGSFFSSDNSNVATAAPIDATGYGKATQILGEMKDANGVPILATPKYIAVPPALQSSALGMYKSQNLAVTGAGSTRKLEGGTNIYQGLYEPFMIRDLAGTDGYWYLFADPSDIAAFGIAYLRGNETPVVEDAPLQSDMLGRAWRGYFDFGVCQIDEQGAVMCCTT